MHYLRVSGQFLYNLLRSLSAYFIVALAGVICIIPIVITLALPAAHRYNNKIYFWFVDFFYRAVIAAVNMPTRVTGREHLEIADREPVIFIANHQSSLDIPVLGSLCHAHPHVWLILEYYANHPIIGVMVRRMNITVDRDNPSKAVRSLIRVINFLRVYPSHLLIFPEGRRFVDGKIHKFFEGFAIIARKTNRKVIPVYMPYNYKIFSPGSILAHYHELDIIIGAPFEFKPDESDEQFTDRVKNWFVEQQDRLKS